jgi:hypothetical protein
MQREIVRSRSIIPRGSKWHEVDAGVPFEVRFGASRHKFSPLALSPSHCGTRRTVENPFQCIAKRCFYRSEEPSFRRTLTTPAPRELSVTLQNANSGKVWLQR